MSFQLQKARPHVYEFCHSLLPYLAFREPAVMFDWLEKGAQAWMARNWELVNIRLEKQGKGRMEWTAGPVTKVTTPLGDAWFVLPPAPQGFAECSWVAFTRFNGQMGYFCLELGFTQEGKPYDLLCAWDAAGKHLNSGTTLGSRDPQWGANSIVEWLQRPPAPERK
jgi:hypothetical protein